MKKITTCIALSLLSFTAFAQVSSGLLTSLTAIAGQRERMPEVVKK